MCVVCMINPHWTPPHTIIFKSIAFAFQFRCHQNHRSWSLNSWCYSTLVQIQLKICAQARCVCSQRECHKSVFLFFLSISYFTEFLFVFLSLVCEYFWSLCGVLTLLLRYANVPVIIALINETKRFPSNSVIIRLATIQHRIDSRWNLYF